MAWNNPFDKYIDADPRDVAPELWACGGRARASSRSHFTTTGPAAPADLLRPPERPIADMAPEIAAK